MSLVRDLYLLQIQQTMFVVSRRTGIALSRHTVRCRACSSAASETNLNRSSASETDKIRDVARLPRREYLRCIKREYTTPEYAFEYNLSNMRRDYAKYGERTGINPGILWPSKEELRETAYYEKKFYPTIGELLDNERAKRLAEAEEIKKREEEVEQNIAKLNEWRIAMLEREAKKNAAAEEARAKREEMIREVREYIGYNVDPSDPKFKEVMEMKEEERKTALKAAKKLAKQKQMLAKLMAVGSAGDQAAQEQQPGTPEAGASKASASEG